MKRLALAAIAALAPSAFASAPATAQDWNAQYVATESGHRVGNPEAPLQLIEFISYTCPHCAHFEQEAEAELRYTYVREGHAAREVRPFIRNIVDIAATLVAECGPEENFFANHRVLLHSQDTWLTRAQELSPEQQARWNAGGIPQRLRAIASDLDFYELMEPQGYSVTELDACLSDQARAEAIVAASNANGEQFNVPGTPSFALNGTLLEGVHSWPALQQALSTTRETPVSATQ